MHLINQVNRVFHELICLLSGSCFPWLLPTGNSETTGITGETLKNKNSADEGGKEVKEGE